MLRLGAITLCIVAIFICAITLMRAGSANLAAIPLSIIGVLTIVFCRPISAAHYVIFKSAPWLRGSGEVIRPLFFALFGAAFLLMAALIALQL